MSTVTSSNEHLTFNADGSSKNILFQANGTQKASISSAGLFTSTTIDATVLTGTLPAISGANLTNLPATDISGKLNLSGGTMTGTVISPSFTSTAGGTFTTAAGNDLNIVYPDSRSLFIKEAGTTHVTIDNTGQVGIGKTPIRALDIKGSGDPGVRLESASYNMDVLTLRNSNGRLDVGPTSGITIIQNGRTGINHTSPEARLEIHGGSETGLYVNSTVAGEYPAIFQSASTGTVPITDFRNNGGTSIMKVISNGDVNIGTGNLVIGTSGKGIDFSVTSNTSAPLASMSNELLDDYEEGSWSPYITTNGGVYTTTSRGMSGFYTKIGRQVTCHWSASITTPTGGSGAVRLNNFPFAAANANHTPTTSMQWGRTTLAGSPMYGMMGGNSSQMWFEYSNSNGNPTQMPASAMNQTTPYHNGQVTYYVD